MRRAALGVCSAVVCAFVSFSASADPLQSGSSPSFVNDEDGGVIPNRGQDPDFVIDPDGNRVADLKGNADQDPDGSDISMYQGQDDTIPT